MSNSEATYPISVPAGCPSYVASSVRDRCNGALRLVLDGLSLENAEGRARAAARDELTALRSALDGAPRYSNEFWYSWGWRTVTQACEDAARLAAFRDALANENLSHVTSGHPVSPNTYHVYVRDPKSPSGCHLIGSASHELPGVDAVLAASGRRTCQGAQRGEMANRRAMGAG